jgi:mRNA interferase RelE/StbE
MYKVVISRSAEKDLSKLSKKVLLPISNAIDALEVNPRPPGCKKLKGATENLWRIRVGDYRIIYAIADEVRIVDVRKVGHRKDIYE